MKQNKEVISGRKSDVDAIAALARRFNVQMVVLFGSAAKKDKEPEDIDIALFLKDASRKKYENDIDNYTRLWIALAKALNVSADKLDITFVSPKTPPLLQYYIARDGKLLFGHRSDFLRFRLKAFRVFFDTEPFRRALDTYLKKTLHVR